MKLLLAIPTAAVALAVAAPPAQADQYDFVSELDSRGVYYSSISDMIDIGKLTCGSLRQGTGPLNVGDHITRLGYSGFEAGIIIVAAARNMCPDQMPTVLAAGRSAPPPAEEPSPCSMPNPPAGCAHGSY
jgi:hypothetical protein